MNASGVCAGGAGVFAALLECFNLTLSAAFSLSCLSATPNGLVGAKRPLKGTVHSTLSITTKKEKYPNDLNGKFLPNL